jgi:predicted protein tyrosine phosphatase
MNHSILVCSRSKAMLFRSHKPWAVISISTESGDFPKLDETNRLGILKLQFWDIANPSKLQLECQDPKLFSIDQAQEVIEFAEFALKETSTLMVHCEAGMSRSPAVAAAISFIHWGPEAARDYFRVYMPNGYVYKTILEAKYGSHCAEIDEAKKILTEQAYGEILDEPWDCKN